MAYMSQEKKALIAAALKDVVPAGWKYTLAVRSHLSIVMTIQSAPVDLLAEVNRVGDLRAVRQGQTRTPSQTYVQVNEFHPDGFFDGELLETFRKIIAALNTGNWNRSDVQTDYFDVGHYVDLTIGRWDRPFVCGAAASPAAAIVAACVARGLSADRLCVSVVR